MAIENGHINSMFRFANALIEGRYGEEKIQISEKYYLMVILNQCITIPMRWVMDYLAWKKFNFQRNIM
jgi:hypothetical protein